MMLSVFGDFSFMEDNHGVGMKFVDRERENARSDGESVDGRTFETHWWTVKGVNEV